MLIQFGGVIPLISAAVVAHVDEKILTFKVACRTDTFPITKVFPKHQVHCLSVNRYWH